MEMQLKMTETVLRFLVVVLALVSAIVVGTDHETENIFAMEKKVDFKIIKSLIFLVIADAIVAGYSLLQGFRCVSSVYMGTTLLSKPLGWVIFSCDQAMTYVTLAAAAAATEAAHLAKTGHDELEWVKVCNMYGKFCIQIGAGFIITFLAILSMVVVSGMSAYHVFRLYGHSYKRGL